LVCVSQTMAKKTQTMAQTKVHGAQSAYDTNINPAPYEKIKVSIKTDSRSYQNLNFNSLSYFNLETVTQA